MNLASVTKGSKGETIYLVLLPMFVGSELMEICVQMLGMLACTLRSMQYHKYDSIRVCFSSTLDIRLRSYDIRAGEQCSVVRVSKDEMLRQGWCYIS